MDPGHISVSNGSQKLAGVTKTLTYIILHPPDSFGQIPGLADSPAHHGEFQVPIPLWAPPTPGCPQHGCSKPRYHIPI